jgi:hypothetical protein
MATVTKDFRIKSGLVVEGTTGTIDGSDIITEDALTGGTQTNITVEYSNGVINFTAESGTDELLGGDGINYDTEDKTISAKISTSTGLEFDGSDNIAINVGTGLGNSVIGELEIDRTTVDTWYEPAGAIDALDTDDIEEGATNLYFTDTRAKAATKSLLTGTTTNLTNISISENGAGGLDITAENGVADSDTDDLSEGTTNLYFTEARVHESITANGGISHDGNGTLSVAVGNGLEVNVEGELQVDTDVIATKDYVDDSVGAIPSAILAVAGDTGTDSVTLTSDTLTISGGTGITTSVANDTVTVDIDSTVATLDDVQTLTNKSLSTGTTLAADLDADGFKVTGLATPTAAGDAATKGYVDGAISGLDWKAAVHLLSTVNIPNLNDAAAVVTTIDGHAWGVAQAGYRVLLTGQTTATQNGIYLASESSGKVVLTRAEDSDTYQELVGAAVFVMEGTTYGSTSWVQSNHYLTDFSNQNWTQFSGQGTYTAGNGLELDGNEFAIDDTVVVTHDDLDTYLNSTSGSEGTTILYVQDYVETAIETGDATATPTYLAIDYNSVATQVAATTTVAGAGQVIAYAFSDAFRSAKFIVKVANGTHTEVSEVLLTLDTSDNVAITEYAVVGTNGSLSTITADYAEATSQVQLKVTTTGAGAITVMGTLLV